MAETIEFRIRRQDSPSSAAYWHDFVVPKGERMNVIGALIEISRNPVTKDGKKVAPPVWDAACLEEVCGSCAMRINGEARQACSALVDGMKTPITIEPLSKFPVVRDLVVDRSFMFRSLKKVKAWIPIDGTYDLGPGQRVAAATQTWAYELSKCMTCGNCLEVCPQVNDRSKFMGAAVISQVRLFNTHPTGAMNAGERLEAIMGEGGLGDCGNAQNCVKACPKNIPLTTSIAEMFRATTIHGLKKLLRE